MDTSDVDCLLIVTFERCYGYVSINVLIRMLQNIFELTLEKCRICDLQLLLLFLSCLLDTSNRLYCGLLRTERETVLCLADYIEECRISSDIKTTIRLCPLIRL